MKQHPRYYAALPFHYAWIAIGWLAAWPIVSDNRAGEARSGSSPCWMPAEGAQ